MTTLNSLTSHHPLVKCSRYLPFRSPPRISGTICCLHCRGELLENLLTHSDRPLSTCVTARVFITIQQLGPLPLTITMVIFLFPLNIPQPCSSFSISADNLASQETSDAILGSYLYLYLLPISFSFLNRKMHHCSSSGIFRFLWDYL